jgi:hypothetical protein
MLFARTPTAIPAVAGPVRARVLETRVDYEQLAAFTVGERKQSEREVMAVVNAAANEVCSPARELVAPNRNVEASLRKVRSPTREVVACERKVVVLEASSGSWLGVSVINPHGKPPFAALPYIEATGTAPPYRECRLCDELTRPGTALLLGTVEAVAHLAGCLHAPPAVSAWVLPENRASHHMFDAVDFKRLRAEDVCCPQDVRVREGGRPLELQLPSSVYISPFD